MHDFVDDAPGRSTVVENNYIGTQSGLSIDQPLTVTAEDGSIVLRPIRKKTLAQLAGAGHPRF